MINKMYLSFKYLVSNNERNSVYDCLTDEQIRECSIVRLCTITGVNSYAVFDNYVKLYKFIRDLPNHLRLHHEVSPSNVAQKIRFDIDMKLDRINITETLDSFCDRLLTELIDIVTEVLQTKNVTLDVDRDVIMFTSHGPTKRSYHIIIDGYCHSNCYDSACFFKEVQSKMSPELLSVVDPNIYHKNHCMRLLFNHKPGEPNRPKIYCNEFKYKDRIVTHVFRHKANSPEHRVIQIFGASLVSMTAGCNYLPGYEEKVYDEPTPITQKRIMEALHTWSLFCRTPLEKLPFKYLGCKKNIISLKRLRPSMCPICLRVHINRPPYLYIHENDLYWCCKGLVEQGNFLSEEKKRVKKRDRILIGVLTTVLEVTSEDVEDHLKLRDSGLNNMIAMLTAQSLQKTDTQKTTPSPVLQTQPPDILKLKNPRTGSVGIKRVTVQPQRVKPMFVVKYQKDPCLSHQQEKCPTPQEIAVMCSKTKKAKR